MPLCSLCTLLYELCVRHSVDYLHSFFELCVRYSVDKEGCVQNSRPFPLYLLCFSSWDKMAATLSAFMRGISFSTFWPANVVRLEQRTDMGAIQLEQSTDMGAIRLEQRTDMGQYDWNRGQTWGLAIRLEQRTDMGAIRLEQRTDMGSA